MKINWFTNLGVAAAIAFGSLASFSQTPIQMPMRSVQLEYEMMRCPDRVLDSVVMVKIPGQHGFGSGFVVSRDGLVVTNYHVASVSRTGDYILETRQRKTYRAKLVKSSKANDLALLKIVPTYSGPYVELAQMESRPGAWCLQIGWSGARLEVENIQFIGGCGRSEYNRIGTPGIAPGDSGGPITNIEGAVIGVGGARRGSDLKTLWICLPQLKTFLQEFSRTPEEIRRIEERSQPKLPKKVVILPRKSTKKLPIVPKSVDKPSPLRKEVDLFRSNVEIKLPYPELINPLQKEGAGDEVVKWFKAIFGG